MVQPLVLLRGRDKNWCHGQAYSSAATRACDDFHICMPARNSIQDSLHIQTAHSNWQQEFEFLQLRFGFSACVIVNIDIYLSLGFHNYAKEVSRVLRIFKLRVHGEEYVPELNPSNIIKISKVFPSFFLPNIGFIHTQLWHHALAPC